MRRFTKLSNEDLAIMVRSAQLLEDSTFVCPKCGQSFKRSEVTQERRGKYVPGGYRIFCPRCGEDSAYNEFRYIPEPDEESYVKGKGTQLWDGQNFKFPGLLERPRIYPYYQLDGQ